MSEDKSIKVELKWLDQFLKHASKQGASSVVIVALVFIFLFFSSPDQKREFIDIWILFKPLVPENVVIYRVIILIIFVLLLLQLYFTTTKVKEKNIRIDELADERNKYQQILLDRMELNSSKDKK